MIKLAQTYNLRPYQEELTQLILAQWSAGNRRVIAQSPTGSGKTVIFSAIAAEFTARGEGVLVLAHREELILQAQEKLVAVTAQPVGIIKAGWRPDPAAALQVASVQSLIRRSDRPSAGLVVIDEAHHSPANSYQEILDCYPEAYVLGVTATPARSDGQGFKKQYDALVLGWSVRKLIDAGYLCSFRLFAAKECIKAADVKVTAGDYNQRELAELVNTTLTLGDVVGTWKKHALGKKTVVFCVDVAHSEAVAEGYRAAGYAAEHLDGESSISERSEALERFRKGETQILVNCALFTEGLDIPDIECVQCLRPTTSLILHLQMVGRGLRQVAGKEYLTVLDHTENWIFHGLPDEEHEWSLEPVSLRNSRWALLCPDCQHCFRPQPQEQKTAIATCPNCGTEIALEAPGEGESIERVIDNDSGASLEEIELGANPLILEVLQRLKEVQEQNRYKPIWLYYELVKQCPDVGLPELRECARLCGYKLGWAWYKWQELQQRQTV